MGGLTIRVADLDSDVESLVTALRRHLNPAADRRRFEWLYRANPWGPARSWLALEPETGEVVGVCSAFPRRLYMGEGVRSGWVLGDFCVAPKYRTAGPAIALQRTCLEEIDRGVAAFCYDFPSSGMVAVYSRLGIIPCGSVVRLAKPLRVDRKVRSVIGESHVRWVSAVGNAWLRIREGRGRAGGGIEICLHEGRCGAEFSALSARIAGRYGVCVQRTAEYLDWRYLAHPARHHEIVVAKSRGELRAYAVFVQDGEDATLVDLFGHREPEVVGPLMRGVIDLLRARGVITLSAPLLDSHPLVPLLQDLGFSARERTPLIVYAGTRREDGSGNFDGARWLLTDGDRDS